jgi:hypothetical protein
MIKDTVDTATGVTGVTLPVWITWVPVAWQGIIAVLGAIVLLLTLYNKILELRLKKRELSK